MSCVLCKTRSVYDRSPEPWCLECWVERAIVGTEGTTDFTVVESEPDDDGRILTAQSFATVKAERARWLWDGRIPLGTATLLVGREKLGKSTLTVELAAQLSRGTLAGDLHGQPSDALLITFEDSTSRTVKPRLMAAGADLSRVRSVGATIDGVRDLVSLPDDGGDLRDLAKRVGARLLVVDPLSAALNGSVDSHRDQDIRRALAPLVALAEDADLALVAVAHWNKGQSGDALTRVLGSRGLTAAVRSVLAFGVSPDSDDGSPDRVLAHVACNLAPEAPSLHCRIEGHEVVDADGGQVPTSRLMIVGECDTRADDLLVTRGADEHHAGEEADDFLRTELAGGPQPAKDVRAAARDLGISERTLERTKSRLGIVSQRVGGVGGKGAWEWALPSGVTKAAKCSEEGGGLSGGGLSENPGVERNSAPPESLTPPLVESGGLRRESPPCEACGAAAPDVRRIGEDTVCAQCAAKWELA